MKNRLEKLKIVFCYEGVDGQEILELLLVLFERCGMDKVFYIHDKKVSIGALAKKIKSKGYWPTGVCAKELDFRYGSVGNRELSYFEVKEKKANVIKNWQEWSNPFLPMPVFIQAWVSDVEYDYWQNACDPIEFTSVGREYLHLPMKSNGLPYPLAQQIVDTAENPGRWLFHIGFIEAIGSTMWLNENFWNYVGQYKKQKLFNESWIRTEVLENGVVKLVAADECFMDESTADKQNRLREILYGSMQ